MGDADADGAAVKRTGRAGEGGAEGARALSQERTAFKRTDGSGKEERRGLILMQNGPPSSGLDSPGKEEQRGQGLVAGVGQASILWLCRSAMR